MIGECVIKAHFSTTVSGGSVELLCTQDTIHDRYLLFVHDFCNGCPHIHVRELI